MSTPNPYGADLADRNALDAFGETPGRIRAFVEDWSDMLFDRSYAPGKWTIRQVLIHLAQTEVALGSRVRFALTQPGYTAQSFSQDDWMPVDAEIDARTALDVYTTLRRMNVSMFRSLTAEQRGRPFSHPEYGELTVDWVLNQMAGHDIHHLKQIQSVALAG
jgi:uncharacterized damage-inducible protein DinB